MESTHSGISEEKILFVCTANICRSPMAEVLLQNELKVLYPRVEVRSAGLLGEGHSADEKSVWAMDRLGLDLRLHRSRLLGSALSEKPDLILTMARGHLRSLADIDTKALDCAFTFKEFIHLANIEGGRRHGEELSDYLERVKAGRSISSLTSPRIEFDVEDPIGRRKAAFTKCSQELMTLVQSLVKVLYPQGLRLYELA